MWLNKVDVFIAPLNPTTLKSHNMLQHIRAGELVTYRYVIMRLIIWHTVIDVGVLIQYWSTGGNMPVWSRDNYLLPLILTFSHIIGQPVTCPYDHVIITYRHWYWRSHTILPRWHPVRFAFYFSRFRFASVWNIFCENILNILKNQMIFLVQATCGTKNN